MKLETKDALDLLATPLPPLTNLKHPLHRRHFKDVFRHLSQSQWHEKARKLLSEDERWFSKTDDRTKDRIRDYIKSGYFPNDVKLGDVMHVASRELAL